MKKSVVTLSKPRYVGCAILSLSKIYMYNFHYNFIKKHWPGNKSRLLFTDTDSLCYEFKTNGDFYRKLGAANKEADIMDFSNYDKDNPLFSMRHHLLPGKFKDEMGGKIISMFIGARSKMYSIQMSDGSCKKTAKGITKPCKEKLDHFKDYLRIIEKKTFNYCTMGRLISKKHQIFTVKSSKIGISPLNDKRYFEENGDSVPFGHYSLVH